MFDAVIRSHNRVSGIPGVILRASNVSKLPLFHTDLVLVTMAAHLLTLPHGRVQQSRNGISCLLRTGEKQPLYSFTQLECFCGLSGQDACLMVG